jgi:hypothetical protein
MRLLDHLLSDAALPALGCSQIVCVAGSNVQFATAFGGCLGALRFSMISR